MTLTGIGMVVCSGGFETVGVVICRNSSSYFMAFSFNIIKSSVTLGVEALNCVSVPDQDCVFGPMPLL